MAISFFISSTFTITRGVISISIMTDLRINMIIINDCYYTRSPSQDFRIFGPRPWKILATTYERNGFLSNPDPSENLVSGNLVMETGCSLAAEVRQQRGGGAGAARPGAA